MKIRAYLFGGLRHALGISECELDLPEGAAAKDLLEFVIPDEAVRAPWAMRLCYAVNLEQVAGNHILQHGDEVAFMPPMAGG